MTASMNERPESSAAAPVSPARETFFYFIRLGFFGFGGPLAIAASMQKDLAEKRKWITPDEFARVFALVKAMPGPIAFQMAVFLGQHRAGFLGGLLAALALNLPAFLMMVAFGVFHSEFKGIAGVEAFLTGMQATALGVILSSVKGLAWPHRSKALFWILGSIALLATFVAPAWEPVFIVASGALTAIAFSIGRRQGGWLSRLKFSIALPAASLGSLRDMPSFLIGSAATSTALATSLDFWAVWTELIWSCFKAGAFVFGSGIAIVPLMEHDFVQRLGWLTHAEFLDALAFGQITPGPVVITSTFIGFKALGLFGALSATVAIYAAPFVHMTTWFPPLVNRLSRLPWISAFLTGAISAVVGAIIATVLRLTMDWALSPLQLALIFGALAAALLTKIPPWSLIPLGGVIAWVVSLVV